MRFGKSVAVRHIALCNVLYKNASKSLVMRLMAFSPYNTDNFFPPYTPVSFGIHYISPPSKKFTKFPY